MKQHAPPGQATLDSLPKEQATPAASGSSLLLQCQEDTAVADSPRQTAQQRAQERFQNGPRQTAQRRHLETLQRASPVGEGQENEANVMGRRAFPSNALRQSAPAGKTHPQAGQVRQFAFIDMTEALKDDGDFVSPQDGQNQSDKERIYSQAFDNIKPILTNLTNLVDVDAKKVLISVGGLRYQVMIKKAPFGGKGSGADFFTMELKRHVRKGKYRNFGKIVVKKMGKPEPIGVPQFDDAAIKKQSDEIGTLDAMSSHPHMPTFHGAVLKDDTYFVGMELAAGDLSSKVEAGASKASVSTWLRQTLQALSHMHANNRAHGDIKGDNVMISQKGEALLGDFGETTNLDPHDASVSDERRYTAQKDDIKRYIQMVYKNLFNRMESGGELLTHLDQKKQKTALDNFCRAALVGSSNADHDPPDVSMQTLAGQLNNSAVWPG